MEENEEKKMVLIQQLIFKFLSHKHAAECYQKWSWIIYGMGSKYTETKYTWI